MAAAWLRMEGELWQEQSRMHIESFELGTKEGGEYR